MLMRTVGEVGAGITRYEMAADPTADTRQRGALTMGFVGEPNVGKSTLINGLFGRKLVGVSATPGRTKHLQTHYLDYAEKLECGGDELSRVLVCDCPGVVFPRFNVPVRLQILFGSFPIAQAREPFSAVRFIAENCAPHLYQVYKLQPVGDDSEEWTPYSLCEAYANLRGFHMKGGMLDVHRAANMLLRDALGGISKKIFASSQSNVNAKVVDAGASS
ncbi:hypothetical protein BBO99_00006197 [Phytophthora kernoviae]|uniref:Guanine nucleotide-binding protein-like 1 n=2 Tax=Phytophthora kernoviae TaxID=325452 RepID=A0A3R7KI73_9STRA|nr:hypothetical protein G195_005587 [Phytophthora kernoviae 00238/432]KAG2524184.1 hypothetical protein JM18_005144 [Phytophthora kernoviae]KAG2528293.1 hypothetical protein JM16_001283 [Phytophthora kernoviae]RLM96101.1 hypothetical protein BBI17_006321 [Phytophthora kernoviae]RLN78121.1 hypothetical protein BBO99_00006197 [Phytophthora kernoviae]